MKILLIAVVFTMFGCAALDNMTDEDKAQLGQDIAAGVSSTIKPIIDAIPVPEPIKEPVKDVTDYLIYGLAAAIFGTGAKKGYDKVKKSKEGNLLG